MKNETYIAVAHWLRGREVTAATPVVVQIGRRVYPAARYKPWAAWFAAQKRWRQHLQPMVPDVLSED